MEDRDYIFALENKEKSGFKLISQGETIIQADMLRSIAKSLMGSLSPNIVKAVVEDAAEEFKKENDDA